MLALDGYWETLSKDPTTGLYRWHDQLESGSDNLITSQCPSVLGEGPESGPDANAKCWVASDAYTLASTDIAVWLYREKIALATFLTTFGDAANAKKIRASAAELKAAVNEHLWDDKTGSWLAYNTSSRMVIAAQTHLLALPVFAGNPDSAGGIGVHSSGHSSSAAATTGIASASQARRAWDLLSKPAMLSTFGVRSASSDDPRYAGSGNYVKPYSNWRGPIWVNTNIMLAYGFADFGMKRYFLPSLLTYFLTYLLTSLLI